MKNVLAALILGLFCAVTVQAEDIKVLPAPIGGDVTFNHKKHVERLKNCTSCHTNDKGGKIEKLSKKDDAHKLCVSCHETKKAGPTKCGQCHKKKR
jgi:predicted CXXCH cytochrome family protein